MIGIGVGIDYALFIVTRYRQGLARGLEPRARRRARLDTSGRAVLFAGCTVVISLLGMFLMGVDFVYGLAFGAVGDRRHRDAGVDHAAPGAARVRRAHHRPLLGAAAQGPRPVEQHDAGTGGAGRPAPPVAGGHRRLSSFLSCWHPAAVDAPRVPRRGHNPTADTTRQAYDLVAEGFGAGFNGPLRAGGRVPQGRRHGVPRPTRDASAADARRRRGGGPTVSPSGDAAVIRVIPKSSPQSVATTDLVATLRDDVIPAAVNGSDVQVHVGGLTASSIDVSERLAARLPIFIGAVLVL